MFSSKLPAPVAVELQARELASPRPVDVHELANALGLIRNAGGPVVGALAKRAAKAALSAWTLDDLRDLAQVAAGLSGLAKRRARKGSSTRRVLEEADRILDALHHRLGEAK